MKIEIFANFYYLFLNNDVFVWGLVIGSKHIYSWSLYYV